MKNYLTLVLFWPSANSFAWQKGVLPTAMCVWCVWCVCGGAMQSISAGKPDTARHNVVEIAKTCVFLERQATGCNTVRHDYCAIPPPIESGVWVILATRNSETYARSWASCRSGATSPARMHPASINRAEQYCTGCHFSVWRAVGAYGENA
jgi:hypothetical protein